MRLIASARDLASRWKIPRTAEVIVRAPAFWMPRIAMHMCSHSTTTITPRGSALHQGVGDLGGQPLLHLRPPRVDLDEPGQLGQAGDPAVSPGRSRRGPRRGTAAGGARSTTPPRCRAPAPARRGWPRTWSSGRRRVDPQAGEEFGVGPGDPGRGPAQTVAVGVLADREQDLPDRALDPPQGRPTVSTGPPVS